MLKHLLIENYALIEKLDTGFRDGLTVITGETGAGKSILLGALSLILGQRADTRVLRNKDKKCIIEGTFNIEKVNIQEIFLQHDLDYDPTSFFRREITPQGKSRAFINDTPVTLQVMKLISERLIDIHSQHESLLVGTSDFQFHVVDGFANILEQTESYRSLFNHYREQKKQLETLEEAERNAKADIDYYQFQHDELDKAKLNAQEFERLEEEATVHRHAEEIIYNLEKTQYLLRDSDINTIDLINEVLSLIKPLSKFGSKYGELTTRIESLMIEAKDISGDVEGVKDAVVHDPGEAARLETRLDQLNQLLLKHKVRSIEELIGVKGQYQKKIHDNESLEEKIRELRQTLNRVEQKLNQKAAEISRARAGAIPGIRKEVLHNLKNLAMPHARFEIRHEPLNALTPQGKDKLTYLFNANPGGTLQELSKIASGGELSRFMLSIKSMISAKNLLPTIIFDEIDTGISGETSTKVANILDGMSKIMQVITITHLPQIASRGDSHLQVYKAVENGVTNTYVKNLIDDERITEVAKMLGGEKPTKVMLETAKELIFNFRNYSSK